MKKNNFKNLILFSSMMLLPFSTISCSAINPNPPIGGNQTPDKEITLSLTDYFKDWNNSIYEDRNKLKKQIRDNVIKKYRLDEWNSYYEKDKKISSVFNINLADYDQYIKNDKYNGMKDFKWLDLKDSSKNIVTKTYNKQDEQFQYMNDFFYLINEEYKNHEDFLYLRWKYYSIFAARLYHIKVDWPFPTSREEVEENPLSSKEINQVNIVDWVKAIAKIILEPGNAKELMSLIYSFMVYYGFSPDFGQFKDYLEQMKEELKKPGQAVETVKNKLSALRDELEKLGTDFINQFLDLYKQINEIQGNILSFKDFINNFEKLINDYKEISSNFKDVIDKWNSLGQDVQDTISDAINDILNLENYTPEIKLPDFINDLNFGLQNCVLHAKLCAKDMLMRLINKNYPQDSNYKLWEAKRQRAFDIYKITVDYANLLFDSLSPEGLIDDVINEAFGEVIDEMFPINKNDNNILNEIFNNLFKGIIETLNSILRGIFNMLSTRFNQMINNTLIETRLVYINEKEFY